MSPDPPVTAIPDAGRATQLAERFNQKVIDFDADYDPYGLITGQRRRRITVTLKRDDAALVADALWGHARALTEGP